MLKRIFSIFSAERRAEREERRQANREATAEVRAERNGDAYIGGIREDLRRHR